MVHVITKIQHATCQLLIARIFLSSLSLPQPTNPTNSTMRCSFSLSYVSLPKFTKPFSFPFNFTQKHTLTISNTMTSTSNSEPMVHRVPGLDQKDMDNLAGQAFQRYSLSSSSNVKRGGNGISILWFRNDLRVLDNEALFKAWASSQQVLPVYCIDPRLFGSTHYFGFPKTGALRAQFLIECLADLRKNLRKYGLDLLIQHGKPEEILPSLAKSFGAHTIYAHKETCSEELKVENLVLKALQRSNKVFPKLQLIWGCTLYHVDDLPFDASNVPDVYTQFRKSIESKSTIRACIKTPSSLGPPPKVEDWGSIPSLDQFGLHHEKVERGLAFVGGESASLSRVHEYFWKKDMLKTYKETRNGMLGPDYSTKFSPWLASGSLSPRFVYEEVMRYERERLANNSTYWVLFELIWRDYFRFLSIKYGNSIFQLGGPRRLEYKWSQDAKLFESWREGKTGYPLIDANMKELSSTGFMSNRGRQIVCSFLVRDMGIDWRMGAEWFETCLLDYDPCSNYGNWTYGAGVGNDPREDRYFSIPKQAQVYDPEGEYVSYWLPELQRVPKDKRHFPGFSYLKPVVPLKYGSPGKQSGEGSGSFRRQNKFNSGQSKPHRR